LLFYIKNNLKILNTVPLLLYLILVCVVLSQQHINYINTFHLNFPICHRYQVPVRALKKSRLYRLTHVKTAM